MARENKRFYWLKFQEDFFSSLRVKKLKKLGADYLIIYLEMQLLSLKTGGYLEYTGVEETFAKELALELDEDADKVQLTLSFLQSCGLLEATEENEFFLPYVEANTGSETASTQRSRKCRDEKLSQNVLQCNTSATQVQHECNIEIRDKSIDKKSDCKQSLEKNSSLPEASSGELAKEARKKADEAKVRYIIGEFNRTCPKLPVVMKVTAQRISKVNARLKTFDEEEIYKAFRKANQSHFMTGGSGWVATFDWFFENDSNIQKVLEGNYDNKVEKPQDKPQVNTYRKFEQHDYDFKALEKKLLGDSG